MGLVDYSDSESDSEAAAKATKVLKNESTRKAAFQRSAMAPGKIAVALPTLQPEAGQNGDTGAEGPPAKRARTGGAFSGFNSLLPAPKRSTQNAAPKAGVSLKTSSEAAFSRNPAPKSGPDDAEEDITATTTTTTAFTTKSEPPPEPKLVAKATRFLPLSVSNKKKKKPTSKPPLVQEQSNSADNGKHSDMAEAVTEKVAIQAEAATQPKPKRSLFSVQQEDEPQPIGSESPYEPLISRQGRAYLPEEVQKPVQHATTADPNSLEAVADDMNLTAAQRRQLFGRNGKSANVTHFNMDSEYAHNEELRQAGEVVEHRAVKAIAPGKHSLQQLVNNARSQKDALDDKFAEGRANRSAGGAKYGWSQ